MKTAKKICTHTKWVKYRKKYTKSAGNYFYIITCLLAHSLTNTTAKLFPFFFHRSLPSDDVILRYLAAHKRHTVYISSVYRNNSSHYVNLNTLKC